MLPALRTLLVACSPDSYATPYRSAVVDANVLLKVTHCTRLGCLRSMRELYVLNPITLIFRALRDVWETAAEAPPLLALLSALARDPLLCGTAGLSIATPTGPPVTLKD